MDDDAPITTREQARAWFQAMGCSHFHMMREDPDRYAQYEALAISKDTERRWQRAAFEDGLAALVSGAVVLDELWAAHASLEELLGALRERELLARFVDATDSLVTVAPDETRILIAETIVGRGPDEEPGGPLGLANQLGDPATARRLAALAKAFCDGSRAPEGGEELPARRAAVLDRLAALDG